MEYIELLITKYLSDTISESEKQFLQNWIEEDVSHRQLMNRLLHDKNFSEKYRRHAAIDTEAAKSAFLRHIRKRVWRYRVWKYAAAAAIIVSAIVSAHYLFTEDKNPAPQFALAEVEPGNTRAILVLDNGTQLSLGENEAKTIAIDDSVSVEMSAEGLTYLPATTKKETKFNTIIVPRGGEYRLTLSDGTEIYLNSESELRYPVTFCEMSERKVQLFGEAYFSVSCDSEKAFVVEVGNVRVCQYGTVFDINAYDDSPEIVLVSGSIGVSNDTDGKEIRLQSGQLAVCGEEIVVTDVDVTPYIEWTNGRFVFIDRRLDDIADILMRWYNVEIEIEDKDIAELHFTGSVGRNETIQHIMNAISYAQSVKVTVSGDKIKISK